MKDFFESFGAVVAQTGGLALLVLYPLIPVLLLFGGLQAAGRSRWSKGTETRWAKNILSYEDDPLIRDIAQDILKHYDS